MLRISWKRANPEGWEEAIKRMMRLRGVKLTPKEARSIVKYLSTEHGLAPEEAKPIMYLVEKRILGTQALSVSLLKQSSLNRIGAL
jgi:quinohemoprotein amine dehydrogenase